MREYRSVVRVVILATLIVLPLGLTAEGALPYAKYVCPPPDSGLDDDPEEEYDGEGEMTYKDVLALKDDYSIRPALYRETWWNFIIDMHEAAVYNEWVCSGLPT